MPFFSRYFPIAGVQGPCQQVVKAIRGNQDELSSSRSGAENLKGEEQTRFFLGLKLAPGYQALRLGPDESGPC